MIEARDHVLVSRSEKGVDQDSSHLVDPADTHIQELITKDRLQNISVSHPLNGPPLNQFLPIQLHQKISFHIQATKPFAIDLWFIFKGRCSRLGYWGRFARVYGHVGSKLEVFSFPS
jgi:hypothetical protein